MFSSLISTAELRKHAGDPRWVLVDCRFDLDRTERGRESYEREHIPGAVYAHLDRDLSGPPVTDEGRHPLPTPEAMQATFERLGIGDETQVVVYDETSGMYACRLWWMLRYMGHDAVAVLDGGFVDWKRAGGAVTSGTERNPGTAFHGSPRAGWLVVKSAVGEAARLIDARDESRYRGEGERRDPRGGHIPGALNYPWRSNIGEDGRFLPAQLIRERFERALRGASAEDAVVYCGSGVTACVNVFAAHYAGFGIPRVYVGSWSEWSRDPAAPVATGAES